MILPTFPRSKCQRRDGKSTGTRYATDREETKERDSGERKRSLHLGERKVVSRRSSYRRRMNSETSLSLSLSLLQEETRESRVE